MCIPSDHHGPLLLVCGQIRLKIIMFVFVQIGTRFQCDQVVCVFVSMCNQMSVCDWTWLLASYLAHLCVCCKTPYMKYSKSSEN